MIDPERLIAIARISGFDRNKNTFLFTYGGDSFKYLKPPFSAYILLLNDKPISSSEILIPAARGPQHVSGRYISVNVSAISLINSRGRFKLKSTVEIMNENPEDVKGSWLCIEKEILENSADLYLFQFMGSAIYEKEGSDPIATVTDYFNNGAHGILVAKVIDGKEVMIPFVDQYVTFNKQNKTMLIPDFYLFADV